MSMGNTGFHPSKIEDRIYDLMTKPENISGSDAYTINLLTDVANMMWEEFRDAEWDAFTRPNGRGGYTTSFAWIENGHLHLIGWDHTGNDKEVL